MEDQPLAFGQHPEEARGSVWTYVAAHGTDKEGLRGILLDRFTRPSSEDLLDSNMNEITPVAVYGAATPGSWSEYSIQVVLDNLLRKPKGVQGWMVIGTVDSRMQHYRIEHPEGTRSFFCQGGRKDPLAVGLAHQPLFIMGSVSTPLYTNPP